LWRRKGGHRTHKFILAFKCIQKNEIASRSEAPNANVPKETKILTVILPVIPQA